MSARASPRLLPWPFVSPTLRVRLTIPPTFLSFFLSLLPIELTHSPDANAFKDAFMKAQKDNESLFTAGSTEAAEKVEEAEAA